MKRSAGVLLFRNPEVAVEVFLVHPGGPFWVKKDEGAWSVPKGEYADDEDALVAAKREFAEETGVAVDGVFISLGEVKQAGGKLVKAWALKHDLDPDNLKSNTFELEWPPRSGRMRQFPEIDSWAWFPLELAMSNNPGSAGIPGAPQCAAETTIAKGCTQRAAFRTHSAKFARGHLPHIARGDRSLASGANQPTSERVPDS